MDAFLKILPIIVVVVLMFAAREGYSILKYVKQYKLHEAARSGKMDKVQECLRAGYAVNAIDPRFGLTPLHVAVRNGHIEIAKELLRHGAGLEDPSAQGITPRQWAVEFLPPDACHALENFAAELQTNQ